MKVKNFLSDLNFLSQFSNIKYKKTRLLLSIIFVNLSAGLDIVIILVFSKYFSNQISSGFWIVETIFDNMFLFPIVVLLRFTFFYLDKLNQMDFKENMPVVFIAPQDESFSKILSNIEEVKARKGFIITITDKVNTSLESLSNFILTIPNTHKHVFPITC